jgi:hypothetical protein
MIQRIKYESDTLLPKEIAKLFAKTIDRIIDVRYEEDKINCTISQLKGDIIRWLSNNKQEDK